MAVKCGIRIVWRTWRPLKTYKNLLAGSLLHTGMRTTKRYYNFSMSNHSRNAGYMPDLDCCIESSTSYHISQKALLNCGKTYYLVEIHTNLSSKSLLLAQILIFTPLYHTPPLCGIPPHIILLSTSYVHISVINIIKPLLYHYNNSTIIIIILYYSQFWVHFVIS